MKNILGLDLGPSSIGWAVVNKDDDGNGGETYGRIVAAGSRIIPMDAAELGDFEKGNKQSGTADRRRLRSIRRLFERVKLRRSRLNRVLRILGFLPAHYAAALDRYGKFQSEPGCPLAWAPAEDGGYRFLFQDAFQEMVDDFRAHGALPADGSLKLPHDWTLYYLRRKALLAPVSREELAWVLLSFNQKRGYYQLRGEDEEEAKSSRPGSQFEEQVVQSVRDSGETLKGAKVLIVELADGRRGRVVRRDVPDWAGRRLSLIVTPDLDKKGQPRYDELLGGPGLRFKVPTEEEWDTEWALVKAKAEHDLDVAQTTVGAYIYEKLREAPSRKVRGQLVRTIDRRYYVEEARRIVEKQSEYHPELRDAALLETCLTELYSHNAAHRNEVRGGGWERLLVKDVLFYQRPLRSQKSLIADCPYERRTYYDREKGEEKSAGVKCIPRSHPLFQEFRLWQFLANLCIFQREVRRDGVLQTDVDVTSKLLPDDEAVCRLYDWLSTRKSVKQEDLLKWKGFGLGKDAATKYRWNYPEEREYPAGETRSMLLSRLKKAGIDSRWLTPAREEALWHLLYSVADPRELEKGLHTFARKQGIAEAGPEGGEQAVERFCAAFRNAPLPERDYGSYSAKALRKLLPLMRRGHHWDASAVEPYRKRRDEVAEAAAADAAVRPLPAKLQGLRTDEACYAVYGRHSEADDTTRWELPEDMDKFLKSWRQHSLRNPVVERVLLEMLRVVRDVWRQVGHIDEIHVEMAREMRLNADERAKRSRANLENERTNLRVKALLTAFMNADFEFANLRPNSPYQQSLFRIFEEAALNGPEKVPDDVAAILKKFNESAESKRPTPSEIARYRSWLEQRYRSPYTGEVIPLSRLFTPAYEIEHIIPQSLYFDNSQSNKVICEAEVNTLKGARLAYNFIQEFGGKEVRLNNGRTVRISTPQAYEEFVRTHYSSPALQQKRKKLLLTEVPETFSSRQLVATRYITRTALGLLSRIVRQPDETEATSRHVIVSTGGVTDRLKKDWGLHDVWYRLILPRFERMNQLRGNQAYTVRTANGHLLPTMPLEEQRGNGAPWKRIDHRHHAMDAIVVACSSRNIVHYLNNESSEKGELGDRLALRNRLCQKTKEGGGSVWRVKKPWDTFTQDVQAALADIVVSFKTNRRVLTSATNYYWRYDAQGRKVRLRQNNKGNFSVRKSLHKDTYTGLVNLRKVRTVPLNKALERIGSIVEKDFKHKLRELLSSGADRKAIERYFTEHQEEWQEIDLKRIKVYYFTNETKDCRYYAVRKSLDSSFNEVRIKEKVTDTGIQKILLHHLADCGGDPAVAFSPEGIERMNRNIVALNDGAPHQPIRKVRVYEMGTKFPVGKKGNRCAQFVENDKGTNLYFAVYEKETTSDDGTVRRQRSFDTIPIRTVIDNLRRGLPPAPENRGDQRLAFILSPGDLVYLPTEEEHRSHVIRRPLDRARIYKMVSCSEKSCFFVPQYAASSVVDKVEYSPKNKMERAITGEMIKESCLPIKVDRLGKIVGWKCETHGTEPAGAASPETENG